MQKLIGKLLALITVALIVAVICHFAGGILEGCVIYIAFIVTGIKMNQS